VARLSRLDALVAQSNRVREIYAGLGVKAPRMLVNNLTLRHLEDIRPQRLAEAPDRVRFVTLNGAASRQKGADVVLGALEMLQDEGLSRRFGLDLYGYTSESARERLAGYPNVRVAPGYAPSEINRVLDGYHVGIVPSVWEEALGYVGFEFLAKGIPVLGNARGGIVDYAHDGTTGWVNQSADAAGLASIMREIINDPQQVVERNHWILEHHDELIKPLERHLAELDELYGEVIDAADERRRELEQVAKQSARR
jgi:glycosyltransferase involved in cell wall biosynthesis